MTTAHHIAFARLVLVAVVGGTGVAYAREYRPDRERAESAGRGRAWWSVPVVLGSVP